MSFEGFARSLFVRRRRSVVNVSGVSIRIFLADGTPDGLRIVEKSNWTGRALVCSRTQFPGLRARPELNRTGVYLLLGYDDEAQVPLAYIGEGDPVLPRLESHDKSKDFWNLLVVFSSKDENLNKAHIQYLEARLVEIAKQANRCKLNNGNLPARPALSEADVADMEVFLSNVRLVYSVLGIKIFDVPVVALDNKKAVIFQIKTGSDVFGRGIDKPEGFVVLKDSKCSKKEVPSLPKWASALRSSLLDRGVLKDNGKHLVFCQEYVFTSPSLAAYVIRGRSVNGRTEWKDAQGHSLKEVQESA